MNKEVYTKH